MPWKDGTTIQEARERLAQFLQEARCYDICAKCTLYPETGEGCCAGCSNLAKDGTGKISGCGRPNLTCLSHTCSVLNMHLIRAGRLEEFVEMTYVLPREGRRGDQRREDHALLQVGDPLQELMMEVRIGIPSDSVEERTNES